MLHNNCIKYKTKLTNENDANVPHTKIEAREKTEYTNNLPFTI